MSISLIRSEIGAQKGSTVEVRRQKTEISRSYIFSKKIFRELKLCLSFSSYSNYPKIIFSSESGKIKNPSPKDLRISLILSRNVSYVILFSLHNFMQIRRIWMKFGMYAYFVIGNRTVPHSLLLGDCFIPYQWSPKSPHFIPSDIMIFRLWNFADMTDKIVIRNQLVESYTIIPFS